MSISILNHRSGAKNSAIAVKMSVDLSLQHKDVLFSFNNYHSSSFYRFNYLLKKEGINNYSTRHINIVLDKLLLIERDEVDRWIDSNVKSKVDVLIIDTLNTSTMKYQKTKKLESSLANLEYISSQLRCQIIALYTGRIPWLLKTNIPLYKSD